MKRRLSIVVVLAALTCGIGLGKKFPLVADSSVPAAQGEVDLGKDKNGNTEVKLKAKHLAKPDSLTPPASAYVVWIQERSGTATNAGALEVNKKLEAEFKTVTPAKTFDIFVTPETDAAAKTPSGIQVLKASVQQ